MSSNGQKVKETFDAMLKEHGEAGIVSIVLEWRRMKATRQKQLHTAKKNRELRRHALEFARNHGMTDEELMEMSEVTE